MSKQKFLPECVQIAVDARRALYVELDERRDSTNKARWDASRVWGAIKAKVDSHSTADPWFLVDGFSLDEVLRYSGTLPGETTDVHEMKKALPAALIAYARYVGALGLDFRQLLAEALAETAAPGEKHE